MTMTLTRWSPVRDLASMEIDRLNRMFEAAFSGEPIGRGTWVPPVDIYETADKDVVVKVELPDMKREDITITFENDLLSIEGERKFESNVDREQYHRVERGHGPFSRAFSLPEPIVVEAVTADFKDGLLTLTMPKASGKGARRVDVTERH